MTVGCLLLVCWANELFQPNRKSRNTSWSCMFSLSSPPPIFPRALCYLSSLHPHVPQGPVLDHFSGWTVGTHVTGSLDLSVQSLAGPSVSQRVKLPAIMQEVTPQEGPQRDCLYQSDDRSQPLGRKPRGWCPKSLVKQVSQAWPDLGHSIPFQAGLTALGESYWSTWGQWMADRRC